MRLIRKIEANVLDNFTGNVYFFTSLSASIQFEDYVDLNGFIAYLQNFTEVGSLEYLKKPLTFGLKNQYNLPTITLEISY